MENWKECHMGLKPTSQHLCSYIPVYVEKTYTVNNKLRWFIGYWNFNVDEINLLTIKCLIKISFIGKICSTYRKTCLVRTLI